MSVWMISPILEALVLEILTSFRLCLPITQDSQILVWVSVDSNLVALDVSIPVARAGNLLTYSMPRRASRPCQLVHETLPSDDRRNLCYPHTNLGGR